MLTTFSLSTGTVGAAYTACLLPCWGPEASRVCWALPAILLLPLLPTQS